MKKLLLFFMLVGCVIPSMANAGALTISNSSGFVGQTVSIPVSADIQNGIIADQFDIQYDPALLTFTGVTPGSATTSWAIVSNNKSPGKLRVGMYNTVKIIGTGQQIALLNFTVTEPASGVTLLALPNLILSNVYFNEATITTLTNGSFTFQLLGDVDGNGKVEAADAMLIAQYTLELTTLNATQLLVADVSHNGTVTMYDASLIAQFSKGIITKFP